MTKNKKEKDFSSTFESIGDMFSNRLSDFGDGPECAEHRDRSSQEQRMRILANVGEIKHAKILDFGCATGYLNEFLINEFSFEGEYTGYDVSSEMIKLAQKKHPASHFELRNILTEGVPEKFDYIFISGTFNDSTGNNWEWMRACLETLFSHARIAIAFNNLSTYVDYYDEHLFYINPGNVFQFCKENLSPLVTLHHDYSTKKEVMPYEFSTYVYQTDFSPRKNRVNS